MDLYTLDRLASFMPLLNNRAKIEYIDSGGVARTGHLRYVWENADDVENASIRVTLSSGVERAESLLFLADRYRHGALREVKDRG